MFRLATGKAGLDWSPRDFWDSTPREFWAALDAEDERVKAINAAQEAR